MLTMGYQHPFALANDAEDTRRLRQFLEPTLLRAHALLEDGQAVGRVRHQVGRRQVRDHAVTVLPAPRGTPPTPGSATRRKDFQDVRAT